MQMDEDEGVELDRRQDEGPGGGVAALVRRMEPQISKAVPRHLDGERMARIVLTAVRTTPELAECSQASLLASIMGASALGLEVNTPLGHAYLIPRRSKDRGMECTLQLGYLGHMELAYRSGMVGSIEAHAVHEGDTFEYEFGTEPSLTHKPGAKPGPVTHAYAVAQLASGGRVFAVLTRAELEARRDKYGGGDAWASEPEAMARKTVIGDLCKYLPKAASPAMASGGALITRELGA